MHTGLIIIYFTRYLRRQLVINKSCLEFLIKKWKKVYLLTQKKLSLALLFVKYRNFISKHIGYARL